MSTATRVILAGHTGLEKAQIAEKLRRFLEGADHALARGAKRHGASIGYGSAAAAVRMTETQPGGRGAIS